PVLLLQASLAQWLGPSQHPLIQECQDGGTPLKFLAITVLAVIVAPVVEEVFFRVLLQGWLEAIASRRSGVARKLDVEASGPSSEAPIDVEAPRASGEALATAELDASRSAPYWPMGISALAFGLAHVGNGPDPIPLFVLGCGLGYLYRQTHSVVPCIVVHMAMNAFAVIVLWLTLSQA
ncbi:MAG TPA: CPBP family intramembrane glutamic endopeptidase, partial [Pirellulaceae bacterium]